MIPDPHQPVLLAETLEQLNIQPTGCYVDCTFGRGGHSKKILDHLGQGGRLVAIDRDPAAVAFGRESINDARIEFVHAPFSDLEEIAIARSLVGSIDGVILDLGISSPQIDEAQRGFSFQNDGPLDMRMDPTSGQSVAEWISKASEQELIECIRTYGEERHARRIARRILEARAVKPIETTGQLAELVKRAVPGGNRQRIHPATRTFQALRIFINSELQEISEVLVQITRLLRIGGRVVVIAFHSLEDRIVKRFFRDTCRATDSIVEDQPQFKLPFRRPLRPTDSEALTNPRARSARLRTMERVA